MTGYGLVPGVIYSVPDAIKPDTRLHQLGELQVFGFGNGDELEALSVPLVLLFDRLDREPAITPASVAGVFGTFGDGFVLLNLG